MAWARSHGPEMAAGPRVQRKGRLAVGGGRGSPQPALHRPGTVPGTESLLHARPLGPSLQGEQCWARPGPSALPGALRALHHRVIPLAHGQLPAEEGRGTLRFHPLDLLACWSIKESTEDRVSPEGGPGPRTPGFQLSSPLHTCQLPGLRPDPNSPINARMGGWAVLPPPPPQSRGRSGSVFDATPAVVSEEVLLKPVQEQTEETEHLRYLRHTTDAEGEPQ